MRSSILLSAFYATAVVAAPSYPKFEADAATPTSPDDLSDYFSMLASKISAGVDAGSAQSCDLSNAVLPTTSPSPLPSVSEGLKLKHVAIGRGTQNYTCDLSNTTAAPAAVGATATLFNATCIASAYPDLLNLLPRVALAFNLTESSAYPANLIPSTTGEVLAPGNYMISGHHYFINSVTPFFDLNTTNWDLGTVPSVKNATATAPEGAAVGQQGEAAVAWLKLTAREGATGKLQEVYRVETAGGSQPATCAGMSAAFEVQYSAQYWFFESDS
ncbi:malate dehydrogenase [Coniella lustricola]|uniref:Malate dehydrogenase n=1 Tax=Coniella lustricola TaxID=2025994 RepID=A0A2T3AL73_9PEZI|nr:malate dehydrogenase [Coniella lustricola]